MSESPQVLTSTFAALGASANSMSAAEVNQQFGVVGSFHSFGSQSGSSAADTMLESIMRPSKAEGNFNSDDVDNKLSELDLPSQATNPAPDASQSTAFPELGIHVPFHLIPPYDYTFSGSNPLSFTAVEIITFLPHWHTNQYIARRFVNNGVTNPIHFEIYRTFRHYDPTVDVSLSIIHIGHDYLDAMRGHNWRELKNKTMLWTRKGHKTPAGWDRSSIDVNGFMPDRLRERRLVQEPTSVSFRDLLRGVKKIPAGYDAADLTRAIMWAVGKTYVDERGLQKEYLFPDHLVKILDQIGLTHIMPMHRDGAIVHRYGAVLKARDNAARDIEKTAKPTVNRDIRAHADLKLGATAQSRYTRACIPEAQNPIFPLHAESFQPPVMLSAFQGPREVKPQYPTAPMVSPAIFSNEPPITNAKEPLLSPELLAFLSDKFITIPDWSSPQPNSLPTPTNKPIHFNQRLDLPLPARYLNDNTQSTTAEMTQRDENLEFEERFNLPSVPVVWNKDAQWIDVDRNKSSSRPISAAGHQVSNGEYGPKQLLRDCPEALDAPGHSELAKAARFAKTEREVHTDWYVEDMPLIKDLRWLAEQMGRGASCGKSDSG